MPRLLSGSTLRRGGSGEFIDLAGAMPQLPTSPSTSTGYTLTTDGLLRTSYSSSLGNIEFNLGEMWSNLPNGTLKLSGTGTGYVYVTSSTQAISTTTGALVVRGGVGIGRSLWTGDDIHVNGLTIGQGYQGTNNVVMRGTAVDNVNEFNEGRASVAIGFDALNGLSTALKSIAIGRYALSSGTNISNSIAIGDSALRNLGIIDKVTLGSIVSASLTSPVVIQVNNHNITTGTQVYIDGVVGMTELNAQTFWVDWLSSSNLALYTNNILSSPFTATNAYISGGTLYRVLQRNNNIAIGSNAGSSLMDGVRNFFFGDAVAPNFTTGSNNFFIGHEVASNMTTGSNNIAIGGDNLVDGQNDQINIGSVFYYDGAGYLQLNADTGLGLGSSSTSTNTGALTVLGGVGVSEDIWLGGALNAAGNPSAYFTIGPSAPKLAFGWANNTLYHTIRSTGGLNDGILFELKDSSTALTLSGPSSGPDFRFEFSGTQMMLVSPSGVGIGNVTPTSLLHVNGTAHIMGQTLISSTITSFSTDTGALQVVGGVGIGENLYVGGPTASFAGEVYIGPYGNKLEGPSATNLQWSTGDIATAGATFTVHDVTESPIYGISFSTSGVGINITPTVPLHVGGEAIITGITHLQDNTNSTSTTTGALQVSGGVGIAKDAWIDGKLTLNGQIESNTTTDGTLVVNGGVGIQGNLNVEKSLSILGSYTATISLSGAGDIVLQTNGSGDVSIGATGGGNVYVSPSTGDVRIEPVLGGSVYINPSAVGSINNMTIGDLPGGAENATFQIVNVVNATSATSTTTGALQVEGGVGIRGNIYSNTGNPEEGYLLYTPKVFVTAGTPPSNPRIGDVWIDSTIPAYLQYIKDGTSTFWIQVGAV